MRPKLLSHTLLVALLYLSGSCKNLSTDSTQRSTQSDAFPFVMPLSKPDFPLSEAMSRVYDNFEAATPQHNELYTMFKYSEISGLDYNGDDGTLTRRDPTRIIKANGKYYMWYTLRNTPSTYVGAANANDTIPSADWDLSDIGYATSLDGFHWQEQGVAVHRPEKPILGWRSVSTPEILVWKDKYYLYYQAFSEMSGKRGDDCPVAMSYASSPDGPWTPLDEIVIPNGKAGEWDQYSIHDPQPIIYKGKIYLYYKSDYNGVENGGLIRSQGLAIADRPEGPFEKYELNPVISSGHETQLFRFKEGIASIMAKDGHESTTIQYAEDGKNFKMASICAMMPEASGLYDPDAFTDAPYAQGITWGVCHYQFFGEQRHSILLRFDCDLSLEINDPKMKENRVAFSLEELLRRGLSEEQKTRILDANNLN